VSWARDGDPLTPIPAWMLSQRRAGYTTVVAARVLEWILRASLIITLALAVILTAPHVRRLSPLFVGRAPRLAALALFIVLAVVHTWPLASDPAHLSRNENGDTLLNTWIVAWVIHQAPRAPLQLFNANIFYPEPNTLAYSEALLVQSAMGAPLVWAGASPVLTVQHPADRGVCVDRLGGVPRAGPLDRRLVGGTGRRPRLRIQRAHPDADASSAGAARRVPAVRVAGVRSIAGRSARAARGVVCGVVRPSGAGVVLSPRHHLGRIRGRLAVRPEAWTGKRALKLAGCLVLAGLVSLVVLVPYLLPYWSLSHGGFKRPIEEVAGFVAHWRDYLTTPGRLPRLFLANWMTGNGLYPVPRPLRSRW
jgi:hypothetical protein